AKLPGPELVDQGGSGDVERRFAAVRAGHVQEQAVAFRRRPYSLPFPGKKNLVGEGQQGHVACVVAGGEGALAGGVGPVAGEKLDLERLVGEVAAGGCPVAVLPQLAGGRADWLAAGMKQLIVERLCGGPGRLSQDQRSGSEQLWEMANDHLGRGDE